MADATSQRDWVNYAWSELFGYPFDDWALDRIGRGASARQVAREIDAMTSGRATISANTLANWFPQLKGDQVAAA